MNANSLSGITKDENFCFKDNTTYHLGGKATCFYPKYIEEVVTLLEYFNERKIKYYILGNGSNILASDEIDGVVISTKNLDKIKREERLIICGAGVKVSKLLNFCIENNLSGLEYLAGIPATIGGLAYMNGGAFNKYIGKDIICLDIIKDRKILRVDNKWCKFSYKHSTMSDINAIIGKVYLSIKQSDRQSIIENIKETISKRAKNPVGYSCGCVFKNFKDISAGRLIDLAGLKGKRIGGAYVSERHANFIINVDGTPDDIFKLICLIKRDVYDKFHRELKEEVKYIGEFNEINW